MRRLLVVVVWAAAWSSCLGPLRAEEENPLVRDLRSAGITPTREGLVEFLDSVRPSEERTRRVHEAIGDLDDPDYTVREEATRLLVRSPRLPRDEIEALTESADTEVRMRALRVLRLADFSTHRAQIVAILRYLERHPVDDLVPILLDVAPEWKGEPYVAELFVVAVAASARDEDRPALRSAFAEGSVTQRRAAVAGLAKVENADFDEELRQLVRDEHESVKLAAATALLERGHRDALARIVELLDGEDLQVRLRAARTMRSVTGHQVGYAAYDEPDRRAAAVAGWGQWLDQNAEAELRLPVARRSRVELGRILVGVYAEKTLREIDEKDTVLWEAGGFTYPWGCYALPNGHRLGVDYRNKYVVEFDAHGNKVWMVENLPGSPTNVERLPSGNTLVALAEPGVVVELSPDKKTVWSQKFEGRPTTAQRLENGNTLVCLQFGRRVVEVAPTGKVVWTLDGLSRPHTAQRLENGNTLVCEMDPNGRTAEYNLAGKLVWEKKGLSNPAQAQRLANGNTVISCSSGLVVVDREGEQIRHLKVSRSRFHAF